MNARAPDQVAEIVAGDDGGRVGKEMVEDAEGLGLQLEAMSVANESAAIGVELEVTEANHGLSEDGHGRSAYMAAQARSQARMT